MYRRRNLIRILIKNKAEVIKMSIYEYDKEFEEKKLRKAEFEYGQHELLKTQIQKNLPKENLSMKLRTLLKKVLSSFRNLSMNWNMKRHIRN